MSQGGNQVQVGGGNSEDEGDPDVDAIITQRPDDHQPLLEDSTISTDPEL